MLLRIGVCPYEYMDDWEKSIEATLPEKEYLNMEDITDADCMHAKKVCKDFEIKKLGPYHDLYLEVMRYFWLMFSKTSEKCV